MAGHIQWMDLSENNLTGSLPADAHLLQSQATLRLAPMSAGHGLCGAIPANLSVVSESSDPGSPCPGSTNGVVPSGWTCSCPTGVSP